MDRLCPVHSCSNDWKKAPSKNEGFRNIFRQKKFFLISYGLKKVVFDLSMRDLPHSVVASNVLINFKSWSLCSLIGHCTTNTVLWHSNHTFIWQRDCTAKYRFSPSWISGLTYSESFLLYSSLTSTNNSDNQQKISKPSNHPS